MARSVTGAAETKASHEVMVLVSGSPALSLLVIRLRESGLSWRDVKTAIDAERKKNAINHDARLAAPSHTSAARGDPCPLCQ
jgi:hypothetical protein